MVGRRDALVHLFFNYADRQAIFSVFPLLEREMHLTTVQLGLLGLGVRGSTGSAAPFAGLVVDRMRRKTAILGGLYTWSIICFATVMSQNSRNCSLSRRRGPGRDVLLPGFDVADR